MDFHFFSIRWKETKQWKILSKQCFRAHCLHTLAVLTGQRSNIRKNLDHDSLLKFLKDVFFFNLLFKNYPPQKYWLIPILSARNIKIGFINNNNKYNSVASVHRFRYVVIPSANFSSGRIGKESIIDHLVNAGVDINDIDEVANYYGKLKSTIKKNEVLIFGFFNFIVAWN